MKRYNRPEILIEDINVEDILAVSVSKENNGAFTDWELGQSGDFSDLW